MARQRIPSTPALRVLRNAGIEFEPFVYDYEEKGGTAQFAALFDKDEHAVVKTLIVEDDQGVPMVVLMHGDRSVSLKELARERGVKRCAMCDPATANRHSGYQVGGTSPLGTRRTMDVYVERTILDLDRIYLNGGARGFIIGVSPTDLGSVLDLIPVEVGLV